MISNNLKTARKACGYSLQNLEDKIGNVVSRQALHRYEKGEVVPSDEMLSILAEAMNTTTERLKSEHYRKEVVFGEVNFHEYSNSRYWAKPLKP